MHPRVLTPGAPGRREVLGGSAWPPAVRVLLDLGSPSSWLDCGASPAAPPAFAPWVTLMESLPFGGPAGHMVSALCPLESWGGRRNKTELFGGTSKVHFSNQEEFPSFPLMFCLCVVLDLNEESEETGMKYRQVLG